MTLEELSRKLEKKTAQGTYIGMCYTGLMPIHYRSYYGKKRAQEIQRYFQTYQENILPYCVDCLESVVVQEPNDIPTMEDGTLYIPVQKEPFLEETIDGYVSTFLGIPSVSSNHHNKVYQLNKKETV